MHAIAFDEFGNKPSMHERPVPSPGAGEVRVRVKASSLNNVDVLILNGAMKAFMEHRFPLTLGRDFAGTIDAVGPDVAGFAVGDEVFGVVSKPYFGDGAFAEYVAVPTSIGLARRPAALSVPIAGALGLAGVTAYVGIEALAPTKGDTVLISGATGGVGVLAVQLAAARGARVIATARSQDDVELVRGLGAADAVNPASLAADVRALAPNGVSAVLHLAGDPQALAALLPQKGRFASALGVGPDQLAGRDLVVTAIYAVPMNDILERLGAMAASGQLRVPITKSYALDQVPRALADFMGGGKRGKVTVTV